MDKSEYLLSMLMELPPNLEKIEKELLNNNYTSEEVSIAAHNFADECFCECTWFKDAHGREPKSEEVHSTYIYEICKLLLKFGLDPNFVMDDANIMYFLIYVDNGYVAPKTMRLLLENGGNPRLIFEEEELFDFLDSALMFDFIEQENKVLLDNEFRLWLVMLGYGAVNSNGKCYVEMLNHYPVENFREFENFTYEIEFVNKSFIIHIFDKRTNLEVAQG